ncbi:MULTISPECIES: DUF433 domain-containing protein [unclassified Coleofasciculus]|uniref:DUF433 domain-containing protein n=1 Tax=unclassified Coleofasciculus TaxID=2692782 RepID=UPI0018826E0D|nr:MULTISPECIES: DUF433 domain-containing protein [unclassified Coleofasciculus]MBE9125849.1 DUF433 domain-containing protein [Coleofasciculus sp. LEGE 07081]MBE9149168.1 DUF433 domain-containing protein [Coleofasciculus sp. LEGE 07092]
MSTAILTTKQYIEEREGCYRIIGKRVSLDSIIYGFLAGQSPESIVQSFPILTLEEVYGTITFYLANRQAIDAYLSEGEELFETLRQQARESNSLLYQKLYTAQTSQS